MSYHEIETVHRWVYACRDCDFAGEADSVGQAESIAKHHVNDDIGDENPRPYDNHIVAITAKVLVGRQP